MRTIKRVVIHCSDTFADMDVGAAEIREWHLQRGFVDIGYHWVVRRDGRVEQGRQEAEIGAHVLGHNRDSIGICWVGGRRRGGEERVDNRTPEQRHQLHLLVQEVANRHGPLAVHGHKEFNPGKACPCFEVAQEFPSHLPV